MPSLTGSRLRQAAAKLPLITAHPTLSRPCRDLSPNPNLNHSHNLSLSLRLIPVPGRLIKRNPVRG